MIRSFLPVEVNVLSRLGLQTVKPSISFIRWALRNPRKLALFVVCIAGSIRAWLKSGAVSRWISYLFDQYVIMRSWLVHYCSTYYELDYRKVFKSMPLQRIRAGRHAQGHSHPRAAGDRSVANMFIDDFIAELGKEVYSVSMSAADQRAGISGSRLFYNSKDTHMSLRCDPITDKHVIKMVDVDYYVDLPTYASYGCPMVLYTFIPPSTAGSIEDGLYSITSDVVTVHYSGGAHYTHRIWDFDHDTIQFDYWFGSIVFLVEKRPTHNAGRYLVFLQPVRIIYGPVGWLLSGPRLKRVQFSYGNFNVCRRVDNGHPFWHFSLVGDFAGACVPERLARAALIRCQASEKPQISDIERIFRTEKEFDKSADPAFAASLFYKFLKERPDGVALLSMHVGSPTQPDNVIDYQAPGPLVTEDGRPSGRLIRPIICEGGVIPVRSYNNDVWCVEERIYKVVNNTDTCGLFYIFADEFTSMLITPDLVGVGCPWSLEQVEAKQNRPAQLARSKMAHPFMFVKHFIVKSFQKAEAYLKFSPPRNISTVPTDHRLRYSAYTYPLAEILKTQQYYAFSLTPEKLESKVRDVCSHQDFVLLTDYSKFDGTHGKFLVDFEEMVLTRFFATEYHDEVLTLFRAQHNAAAITAQGHRYSPGLSRLSGSSETSLFNTLDNALVAYITMRRDGKTPIQAYADLGLYGGDDGFSREVSVTTYESTAALIGLNLKAVKVECGNPVKFLGRIFYDPWVCGYNICDVNRIAKRLHITTAPLVVPHEVARINKARGYLVTDPNTPLISDWARKVIQLYGENVAAKYEPLLVNDLNYWAQFGTFSQGVVDWYSLIANELDVTEGELRDYISRLRDVTTRHQFEALPPLTRGRGEFTQVVVHGQDLLVPGEQPSQPNHVRRQRSGRSAGTPTSRGATPK